MTSDTPDMRFYGRRKGKRLKPIQETLLDTLYPRFSLPTPEEGAAEIDPTSLFPQPVEQVWLEIGFGGGEHLAHQAANNRSVGFIGAEPYINGIGKFLVHADAESLTNVRVFGDDIRRLTDSFPDACLDKAFLLFPDPWPKSRHWKRRFVNVWNLDMLARLLKDGAEFRVASDDLTYIRWALRVAPVHPAFEWVVSGPDDWRKRWSDACPTRYEQKAIRQGRVPTYLTFRRKPRDQGA